MTIMKDILLIVLLVLLLQPLGAQKIKKINVSFDENDFLLSFNDNKDICILSNKYILNFCSDKTEPGLPYVPINILVPSNWSYLGVSADQNKKILKENVSIAPTPISITADGYDTVRHVTSIRYKTASYPIQQIKYGGENIVDNNKMVTLLLCPYKYDVQNKKLYFISSFDLNVSFEIKGNLLKSLSRRGIMDDYIKEFSINNVEIGTVASEDNMNDICEYLIITNSSLASSYQPLLKWKKMKGLKSKILTIEEIEDRYSGSSKPIKIKRCLLDYYQNHKLKYVLLGGDDTVVPVQGCYCYNPSGDKKKVYDMPSDLFYACFGGNFEWDANGNGIVAEVEDSISMLPSIYVTRLPVRTNDDVASYLEKLLQYEMTPTKNGWGNNILMCGNMIDDQEEGKSDAEIKGDMLYDTFKQYWNGSRLKFYDTYTDFEGNDNYELNGMNLQEQIGKGYTFVEMISHGAHRLWFLENDSCYNINNASSQINNRPTIITTTACLTNAFDSSADPCLSESFIRNPNNGVIAYLGCSRASWYLKYIRILGFSLVFEKNFYNELFCGPDWAQHYGIIVTRAKANLVGSSGYYGGIRWVQLGLNPIGDPEMLVYRNTPKDFMNVSILQRDDSIFVNTGISNSTICAMSYNDNGDSYYDLKKNVQNTTFKNTTTGISICITKEGYIPKIYYIENGHLYIQNETISGDVNYEADVISVGANVTSSKRNGDVIFKSGTITLKANSIELQPTTQVVEGVVMNIRNK